MFKPIPLRRGFAEIKPFFALGVIHQAVICGGYARFAASTRSAEDLVPASDVDLFPLASGEVSALRDAILALGFGVVRESPVAISFKKKSEAETSLPMPQIIKPVSEGSIQTVGTVEQILKRFDFTVARCAIVSPTKVLADEHFLQDEENGRLRIKNVVCPISSVQRLMKYAKKGYHASNADVVRIFEDWDNRDTTYRSRLLELIDAKRNGEWSEENPGGIDENGVDELYRLLRVD